MTDENETAEKAARVERLAAWLLQWTRGAMRLPSIEWSEFHPHGKEHIREHAAKAIAAMEAKP